MAVRELNLIPYEVRAKNKQRYINLGIGFICILIIAVLASYTIFEKITINNMEKQAAELDIEISSYNKDLKKKTEINKKIKELNNSIMATKILIEERSSIYERIKGIEKYVPVGLVLRTIDDNGTYMKLTGETTNYYLIAEFAANLQESKEYRRSKIDNINIEDGTGKSTFTINIEIEKRGDENEETKEK